MAASCRGRKVLGLVLLAASTMVLAAGDLPLAREGVAPGTGVTPLQPGSVDAGRDLYASICFNCHGVLQPLSSPSVAADMPSRIKTAINPQATMGFLKFLTEQNILDVATYIARPATTDIDRLLDWAEQILLAELLGAPSAMTQVAAGYRYRYYSRPGIYVGAKDGIAYVLYADTLRLYLLGPIRDLLVNLPTGR